MPMKCCIPYCKSNYSTVTERTTIFGFPKLQSDFEAWLKVLPSTIKKITKFMGVCAKHWPADAEMVKIKRFLRPVHPPSLFLSAILPAIPKRYTTVARKQTKTIRRRKIRKQSTPAAPVPDFILQADEASSNCDMDLISSWQNFRQQIQQLDCIKRDSWLLQTGPNTELTLLIVIQQSVECAVCISGDFTANAYRQHTPVYIADLIGCDNRIERISQLEAVLNRLVKLCELDSM
ncbi:hypothetical protein BOX15_Mlig027032g1 [Macrostomum lignano]|uniref:Uncharacterized protein n=2 Tax=Macrostomum lignano TaxID=282301 RepID=A0A267DYY5_9PLAT|nr:hypothetical protein BOX15_Mlig027032g1 [Macrostomum lignano]